MVALFPPTCTSTRTQSLWWENDLTAKYAKYAKEEEEEEEEKFIGLDAVIPKPSANLI
jgi:hypothetical protein